MNKEQFDKEFYAKLESMFDSIHPGTLRKLRDEFYYTQYRSEIDPIIKRSLLRRMKAGNRTTINV